MAKKPSYKPKITANELGARLTILQTKYSQKELAAKLGISVRTLNYYQSGHNMPKSKAVYEKINRVFNQNKNKIAPEQIIKRETQREKRSKISTEARSEWQRLTIHEVMDRFRLHGYRGMEILDYLDANGYIAAYFGTKVNVPDEFQFMPANQNPEIIPRRIALLGINQGTYAKGTGRLTKQKRDKIMKAESKDYDDTDIYIMRKPINTLVMPDFLSAQTFEQRMNAARSTFLDSRYRTSTPKKFIGYIVAEDTEE